MNLVAKNEGYNSLGRNGILIFDYPKLAEKLRGKLRENAAKVAEAAGVSIEHISKSHIQAVEVHTLRFAQHDR